jgi:hypothetical protein
MANTPPNDVKALQEQIERLQRELDASRDKVTAAEAAAKEAVAAQGLAYLQRDIEEQPTGQTVKMKVPKNARDPDSEKVEIDVPTYFYKIDLPPIGGTEIKINGEPYYHGTVYKLDLYLLRSIKEIVARAWGHENNIRGSNENAYRTPSNRTLRGGARVH